MTTVISASEINLRDLRDHFGLRPSSDDRFFLEWQEALPELSAADRQALDGIKADYLHLSEYTLLEPIVKMVVVAPLLKLAGLYRSPFYFAAEKSVEIVSEDEAEGKSIQVRGRLDALVFTPEFWVLVIEAKRTQYSLEVGIPQLLTYMLDAPQGKLTGDAAELSPSKIALMPVFGWVTNGREFQFLKLQRDQGDRPPIYGFSDVFSLYRGRDLDWVLQILKRIAGSFQS